MCTYMCMCVLHSKFLCWLRSKKVYFTKFELSSIIKETFLNKNLSKILLYNGSYHMTSGITEV